MKDLWPLSFGKQRPRGFGPLPLHLLFVLLLYNAVPLSGKEDETVHISRPALNAGNEEAAAEKAVFHNQFAVHVPGGSSDPSKVENIASRHGFINLGQIGSLEDHFLLEHRRIVKRSADLSQEHHTLLEEEEGVEWFEQQRELKREKRDLRADDIPFSDPLFPNQWFLVHGAADGSDMNVQPAWKMGYTGKKVVVTILDDGIQHNHPDLKLNYDPKASSDINGNDDDPMPQDNNDNKHGTR